MQFWLETYKLLARCIASNLTLTWNALHSAKMVSIHCVSGRLTRGQTRKSATLLGAEVENIKGQAGACQRVSIQPLTHYTNLTSDRSMLCRIKR